MKFFHLYISTFFLLVILIISCSEKTDNKKVPNTKTPHIVDKQVTKENTEAFANSNLKLIKALAPSEKYHDWGNRPSNDEDGPAEPWTWPWMMCSGPSQLDRKIKSSSTLSPNGNKSYAIRNICDDDPTSAWVEGKEDHGVGEYIEMEWHPMGNGIISILNGYQASKSTWENNSRIKHLKVSDEKQDYCIVELADVMGIQKFKIPGLIEEENGKFSHTSEGALRFTILEVYPGQKFKDTAISGIFSCGG